MGGDRYRLVEKCSSDARTEFWLAHDELLARPVALTVHTPGGEAAGEFLNRAHRLSSLSHPAVGRVYDAVDEGRCAYVVSEWVGDRTFTDVLSNGPLDPDQAADVVGRVAEAVAEAHTLGVAIGGLHPDHIRLAGRGVVVDRVANARATFEEDITALGGLLYAALTGGWPLGPSGSTRPGPRRAAMAGGQPVEPRQLRPSIPHDLSALAMKAMRPDDPRGIRSAQTIASLLTERRSGFDDMAEAPTALTEPVVDAPNYGRVEPPRGYYPPDRPDRTGHRTRFEPEYGDDEHARSRRVTIIAVLGSIVALALVGWLVASVFSAVPDKPEPESADGPLEFGDGTSTPGDEETTGGQTTPGEPLTVRSVTLFDPQGDGQDHPGDVANAIDSDPGTEWLTAQYRRSPTFGNLKDGMGLLLDLGEPQEVGSVTIDTTIPGADLEIRAGDQQAGTQDAYTVVGSASNIQSEVTIELNDSAGPHRYWVVWLTKLAPTGSNQFEASIAGVTLNK